MFTFILYSLYLLLIKSGADRRNINLFRINAQFQALPESTHQIQINLATSDGRVEVLKEFFSKYGSPLLPFTEQIVQDADTYGLDYRLLPAIAMQESNVCKKMPANSYNCWGFGIYGGKITRFSGFEEAITTVSKTLAKEYVNKGLSRPSDIMKKYTPGSNGSWAYSVSYFMDQIHSSL